MKKIDPNYLHDEKYIQYQELTETERETMLIRYRELLPRFEKKADVIDARGFAPMDVLHEIILSDSRQKARSIERTIKTKAIRELQKQDEFLYGLDKTEEQPDFNVIAYIQKHENELSEIFNVKIS